MQSMTGGATQHKFGRWSLISTAFIFFIGPTRRVPRLPSPKAEEG